MKKILNLNNASKKGFFYTIINFLVLFILLSLIAYFVFSYFEKNISSFKRIELENKLTNTVEIESSMLAKELDAVISDITFLKKGYRDKLTNEINIEKTKEDWRLFSESRMIYDQVRFIDVDGNEIVGVNYSEKKAYIVPNDQLQNKKNRYYFFEAVDANEDQIFLSKLNLNIKNGEIEQPIKPMIRFCTPVYNEGELLGVIILNYLAQGILKEFDEIADIGDGEIYLLNSKSFFLSGGNPEKLWAFMYDENSRENFSSDFPNEWSKINDKDRLFYTANGLFVSSEIRLDEKFKVNESLLENNSIILDEGSWIVVSHISQDKLADYGITSSTTGFFKTIIRKYFSYFIFILILSVLISFIGMISRKARERIKFHSEYDAMTKVMNRRAGIEKLKSILPADSRRRTRTCISFIDINGLKEVNDRLGHDKGDELIITVSNVINEAIRQQDFLIRMGGDEFLIVLDNANVQEAESIWSRIVSVFENINHTEDRSYIISVSHGLVEIDGNKDRDIDQLIKVADEKMHTEKRKIKVDLRIIK